MTTEIKKATYITFNNSNDEKEKIKEIHKDIESLYFYFTYLHCDKVTSVETGVTITKEDLSKMKTILNEIVSNNHWIG